MKTKISPICDKFTIAEISDIHFGNGRLSAVRVYEHLQDVLYPLMPEIKLLVINGDTFDTLLNMNSDSGFFVARFIDDITNLAIQYKVFIRIVRGTFSHDRYQNRFFEVKDRCAHTLNGIQQIKVFDTITLEHFNEMNLDILFCPDDQPHSDLTQALIDVIHANHLEKIDLLFSHGYYQHLLPLNLPHVPHNTLQYDRLKKYVRGLLVNGHVHHPLVYERVITSGSFERFSHDNDNTPVGMWLLHCTNTSSGKKWTYEFVENKNATPFTTFKTEKYLTTDALCTAVKDYVDQVNRTDYMKTDPIFVRLQGTLIPGVSEWIREHYSRIILTDKKTAVVQEVPKEELTSDNLPVLTEANLAEVIFNNKAEEDNITLKEIQEILNGI